MLILFETAAGYALFKVSKNVAALSAEEVWKHFTTSEKASSAVKLKAFHQFEDTASALSAATAICEGTLDNGLATFLRKIVKKEGDKLTVGLIDNKLANVIKEDEKLSSIKLVFHSTVGELIRGIRTHSETLLSGLSASDAHAFRLGLSHSLARYKLKFSPDKVDVMIIQAIALLDDLDKELNTYAMRVREWYGWHFPEMGKIVTDNILYAKVVKTMLVRSNAHNTDFSEFLPEEMEAALKEAAEVSMGTEIAEEDVFNITSLAQQVIDISDYRASLYDYLRHRMNAIAPNLTVMVGELVGARLIAHAGSLLSLAKHPASTVQILGAEKALFRALKTKHDTPKYGLIYHASLVGQAGPKMKGKVSRVLAAKTALAVRTDALGETEDSTVGLEGREKVEARLRQLEGGKVERASTSGKKKEDQQKYVKPSTIKSYNVAADVPMDVSADAVEKKQKKVKKEEATNGESKSSSKKDKKRKADESDEEMAVDDEDKSSKSKKDKKEKKSKSEEEPKKDKKDKKRKQQEEEEEVETPVADEKPSKSKKKDKEAKKEKKRRLEESEEETPVAEEPKKKKKKEEKSEKKKAK